MSGPGLAMTKTQAARLNEQLLALAGLLYRPSSAPRAGQMTAVQAAQLDEQLAVLAAALSSQFGVWPAALLGAPAPAGDAPARDFTGAEAQRMIALLEQMSAHIERLVPEAAP